MKETALVTGATSGIGLDLVHLFARDGHDVVLVARHEEKLREVATDLERHHKVAAHVIAADLSDLDAPRRVFEETRTRRLQIDVLVNNAGFGVGGKFSDNDLATQLQIIQLNITALTNLTGLFLEGMLARNSGKILNLASTAAFQPGPLMAVYYASKAYVLSFSEAIAEELKDTGVTVTALCPGPTDTGFAEKAHIENTGLFKVIRPMSSMEVAQVGYKAMRKGKRVVIAGMRNKMTAQSVRVTPRFVVTKVVRALQERR
jgi:short-subunit dehydrogenase